MVLETDQNQEKQHFIHHFHGQRFRARESLDEKFWKHLIQDPPQWLLPVEELKLQDPSLSSKAPLLS